MNPKEAEPMETTEDELVCRQETGRNITIDLMETTQSIESDNNALAGEAGEVEEIRETVAVQTAAAVATVSTTTAAVAATAIEVSYSDDEYSDEDETRSRAVFRHVFTNFSQLKDSVMSDAHYIRCLPWRILAIIKNEKPQKTFGFFLQCNADSETSGWSCQAEASLRIIPQRPDVEVLERKINHTFHPKENDWGFSNFITWSELMHPEKGFCKDDSIILEVAVRAEAPHGVAWNSKKYTGFVGIKNQGATCYMNSLLQTLYFTNYLRKVVYKMPTESDECSTSLALALQRVFYDLQFNDKAAGTKKLTKSFGWEAIETFMQHDVQEFLRVLLDKLESKMKGTCIEGTVPYLFRGSMISYIKCKNVDYKSSRNETFYDIQLKIKDLKNIYESFDDYIAPENLEGENKYDAGEHGLQDAVKGVIFSSFPPVLYLHLMRFHYDAQSEASVKSNDRFEFYEQINLENYLEKPEETPAKYTLLAILVHSGDHQGGHYVVFINPQCNGKWFRFDDDAVSKSSRKEAIKFNFGGAHPDVNVAFRLSASAYLLLYVRNSHIPKILGEVNKSDIPEELEAKIAYEKKVDMMRRQFKNEAHTYFTVTIVLEDSFVLNGSNDLFNLDEALTIVVNERKTSTVSEFIQRLANYFNYPESSLRIWPMHPISSQQLRPTFMSYEFHDRESIGQVFSNKYFFCFLEFLKYDLHLSQLPYFVPNESVVLFIKYYDSFFNRITYIGNFYFPIKISFLEIAKIVNPLVGLSSNAKVVFFGESRSDGSLFRIAFDTITIDCEIKSGDVLLFEKFDDDNNSRCIAYLEEYNNSVDVIFADRSVLNDVGFLLNLPDNFSLHQIANAVSEIVNIPKESIQILKINNYGSKDISVVPVRYAFDGTLKDLLLNCRLKPKKLYYQKLDIPLSELDNKKQLKCICVDWKTGEEKEYSMFVNSTGIVSDILNDMRKHVTFSENGTGKLRLFELTNSRLLFGLKPEQSIESILMSSNTFRVEEIPKDEIVIHDNETLIAVAHFHREPLQTFGTPFVIKIRDKEHIESVKERIKTKLNVSEKDFSTYKFALVQNNKPVYMEEQYVFDTDLIKEYSSKSRPWIGLDHINKSTKRARTLAEKSVKIYN